MKTNMNKYSETAEYRKEIKEEKKAMLWAIIIISIMVIMASMFS